MDSAMMETIAIAGGLAGIECREDFDFALQRQWRRHERNGNSLSLVLFEIDFFRQYQAACGIAASDECLDAIATVILENARRPDAQAFAWGDGRFAILLPETGMLEADRIAQEIRFQANSLMVPHPRSPMAGSITATLGLASARPATGMNPNSLMRDAELALESARQRGRSRMSGPTRRPMSTV